MIVYHQIINRHKRNIPILYLILDLIVFWQRMMIMPKNRDQRRMLDGDSVTWDYVISALGRNGKIDKITKQEIFNTGKGLFFRSLDYLTTDTECSHYLIWKSCKEYQIIQNNTSKNY